LHRNQTTTIIRKFGGYLSQIIFGKRINISIRDRDGIGSWRRGGGGEEKDKSSSSITYI